MTRPRTTRRNPRRSCRTKSPRNDEMVQNEQNKSNSSSEQEQRGNDQNVVPASEPEDGSGSTPSEYEVLDQEGSGDDDASSADFEGENEVSVRPKRQAKTSDSGRHKKKRTQRTTKRSQPTPENACLSDKQIGMLDRIFSELDANKNGRISISDILRAAEDYGLDFGSDEARDMVRFWDSSGTVTISRATFTRLAIDSKFMVPASQ